MLNEGVADFLGGNAAASGDVRYGPDGVVRFANLRLVSPLVSVTSGEGSYSRDGRLAVNARGVSRQYGPLGRGLMDAATDPDAVITASRPDFGIGLAGLEARLVGTRGGYRVSATGQTDYGPLTADLTLGTGATLTVMLIAPDLGGIAFAGSLRRTPAGPFAGELTANGQGVIGLVRLDASGAYQEALVSLRARDTVLPGPAWFSVNQAIVDARIVLYEKPWIVADVQLAGARIGAFDLAAARAKIDYRDGRGTARALVEATSGVPFRLALNAEMQPGLWRATRLAVARTGIPHDQPGAHRARQEQLRTAADAHRLWQRQRAAGRHLWQRPCTAKPDGEHRRRVAQCLRARARRGWQRKRQPRFCASFVQRFPARRCAPDGYRFHPHHCWKSPSARRWTLTSLAGCWRTG